MADAATGDADVGPHRVVEIVRAATRRGSRSPARETKSTTLDSDTTPGSSHTPGTDAKTADAGRYPRSGLARPLDEFDDDAVRVADEQHRQTVGELRSGELERGDVLTGDAHLEE